MPSSKLKSRKPSRKELLKISDKMTAFAQEYLVDFNGKAAAVRAGYPAKTASNMASKLLRHPVVAKIVGAARQENAVKLGLERDNVLAKVSHNLNRTNIRSLEPTRGFWVESLHDLPDEVFAFIDGFEVVQLRQCESCPMSGKGRVVEQKIKIKLSPNAAAQDMAMRFIGAYAAEKHTIGIQKPALDYEELSKPADLEAIDVVSKRLGQES